MSKLILINEKKKKWAVINVISKRDWEIPDGWQKVANKSKIPKGHEKIVPRGRTGLVNAFNKLNPVASCPQAQKSP
jgi:hypothetical protein